MERSNSAVAHSGILDATDTGAGQLRLPEPAVIHRLFERQVSRHPDVPAIVCGAVTLTYAELDERARILAAQLIQRGIGRGDLVGLCVDRSVEMVVGILGVLKSGAAYVPIDPCYPDERIAFLLHDSAPKCVLAQSGTAQRLPRETTTVLLDSQGAGGSRDESHASIHSADAAPRDLAYVIYTSGSTGEPKGVMVEHGSVVNLWAGLELAYREPFDCRRIAINAPFTFDASVQQLVELLSGCTLIVVPQAARLDAQSMLRFLDEYRVEGVDCTPSQLRAWVSAGLLDGRARSLRTVLVGGEAIDPVLWNRLARSRQISFYNVYGPTECTVDSTSVRITEGLGAPTIGSAMPNRRIYILDEQRRPVAPGQEGEIYIGGTGVARGYLRRPALTASRFLQDPFSDSAEGRVYKTGDIGRWRADGLIEYLGRNDHQVKIRGFRIELGEIEAQLVRHPDIREAVVVAREDSPGNKRLVAYVTQVKDSGSGTRVQELRAHLLSKLPEYMVPSAFVTLPRLPLMSNGKLDVRALPEPALGAYASREYEAPTGDVETLLAAVWQELLRVERVGREDHFFELGGHSLLIVQLLDHLRHHGLTADVREVFGALKLREMAGVFTREASMSAEVPQTHIPAGAKALTPEMVPLSGLDTEQLRRLVHETPGGIENIKDVYPLAPLQEGMLFHYLLDENRGDTYIIPILLTMASRERLDKFVAALQAVIDRHDILRTGVIWRNLPRPMQVVCRRAVLAVEELCLTPDRDPMAQLRERMSPEYQRLDMRRPPLVKLQVAKGVHGEWYALLQLHHVISDHESVETLLDEVMAFLEGRADSLPEPVPYRNHVAQALAHARTHDAEEFFTRKLGTVEEPTAPFGLLDVHGDGSRIRQEVRALDPELARRLRFQARRLGVTAATLFHAAWALVMARTSGSDDVVFGTVLLGRLQGSAGAKRTLGMFINTLPLRLQLKDITARQLVEGAQRELVDLFEHEQASLAIAQRCSGVPTSVPLFTTLLNHLHSTVQLETGQPSLSAGIQVIDVQEWTNYPVVLSVDDQGTGFTLTAQTDQRIDPVRMMGYIFTAMESLVGSLETAESTPALQLTILSDQENKEVLELFNATQVPFPQDERVHELFDGCVERTPHAIAVVFEQDRITYAQLQERANKLAAFLRREGLQPGQYVPLMMSRSLQMLVSQIAVMKCGGTYVPIDPNLPAERQAYIVRDCQPSHILSDGPHRVEVGASDARWIDCVAEAGAIAKESADPGRRVQIDAPAYVMYTSGSTGTPKGVVVPHRAVIRLVVNSTYCPIVSTDCVPHYSNPAFDASTFEIWGPLLNGATVLVVPQSVVLEVRQFGDLLNQHNVTVLWMTVGLFVQYTEALESVFRRLRCLIVGGETVDPGAVKRVLQNSPPRRLLNAYGPTECTTFSTVYPVQSVAECEKSLPIGFPITNTRVYILNGDLQPVPVGVAGEIYVAGPGVACGYLNRAELTAERFLRDPFSADANDRMYKTGDLGRWRPDGAVEYLGRNDRQIKLRGFRIELGEIEARLLQHSAVKEAVVLAREDEPGDKRIVAYVVGDLQKLKASQKDCTEAAGAEVVDQWNLLYEETYSAGAGGPSFVGWNSSYTGQPIPEEQMQEWLNCTLARIRSLRPKKVLEIGCGVGLLLQHLAPESEVYVGTDFSAAAVESLGRWMKGRDNLAHVQLFHREATDLSGFADGSFDTVIVNSVVQYFPDIDYLVMVIQDAARLLAPGGKIFVGDVRNLPTLATFHAAVQLGKAGATITSRQLRRRVARAVAQDKELVIDPQFFTALMGRVPGIRAAETLLKRGRAANELTRHRYDAILYAEDRKVTRAVCEPIDWETDVGSIEVLETALRDRRWPAARIRSIPSSRIVREALAARLLQEAEDDLEASSLRRQLNEAQIEGVDPVEIWDLCHACGYDARVSWDADGTPELFEVRLIDLAQLDAISVVNDCARPAKRWSDYATDPLENGFRQRLIPELKDYLKDRLPDYMIPSAWVTLKQLPLTPNGKIDRRALPVPQGRPEEMGEYVAPLTDLEVALADLWAQVLRVDQVGVKDNFFDLGGHSLLATQVVVRIHSTLSVDMPMKLLFEAPTIAQLAPKIEALRQENFRSALEAGGDEVRELLEQVASMSESQARELARELGMEGQS